MPSRTFNVLFLCTGNSARSIMAESILNQQGLGRFQAFSAGSQPAGQVHPYAIELLQRNHFPVENLRSKNWDEFAAADAPQMDFVLTVCDHAKAELCPVWPGQPMSAHWGVADPVAVAGDEATPPAMSQAIADRIPGAQLASLDAAHLSAVEQPEAFAQLLERFWTGLR